MLIAGGGVAALEAALALRALAEGASASSCSPRAAVLVPAARGRGAVRARRRPALRPRKLAAEPARLHARGARLRRRGPPPRVHVAGRAVPYDAPHRLRRDADAGGRRRAHVPRPGRHEPIERLLTRSRPARSGASSSPCRRRRWSLPAYELALMTAAWLAEREIAGSSSRSSRPSDEPLQLFGREASDAVGAARRARDRLSYTGIRGRGAGRASSSSSATTSSRPIASSRSRGCTAADRRHPADVRGIHPRRPHGRVTGLSDVYAAGDITTFPVKQGGIAAQQAEAAAEAIAAAAGVDVTRGHSAPSCAACC